MGISSASVLRTPRTQPPALIARPRPEFSVENPALGQTVLTGVSWAAYEQLLADRGPRGPYFTYDRGVLEIMTHGSKHEKVKEYLAMFARNLIRAMKLDGEPMGNLTLTSKSRQQGFEPDACFYLSNLARIRGKDPLDFEIDPAPDLIVEVDISRSSIRREPIYAGFKVKELWRFDGDHIHFLVLNRSGKYVAKPESHFFKGIKPSHLEPFLELRSTIGLIAAEDQFLDWARSFASGKQK